MKFNCYDGEYLDDLKHGYGVFSWEAGNKYEGFYKFDERDGWGEMHWIDGSSYKGQWKEGIQHGFGIMYFDKTNANKKKVGFFENNVFVSALLRKEQLASILIPEETMDEIERYLINARNSSLHSESVQEF